MAARLNSDRFHGQRIMAWGRCGEGTGPESSKCSNMDKRTQILVHIKSRVFLSFRDKIHLPSVQLLNLLSVQFGAPFTSQVNLY